VCDSCFEKYVPQEGDLPTEKEPIRLVKEAKANMMSSAIAGPQMVQEIVQGAPTSDQDRAAMEEMNEFTETLRTQLEIFVNRMKSNSSRGRPIGNDSSVQTLFMNIMTMHGKLMRYIQDQEDGRLKYEGLQDRLTQIKDATATAAASSTPPAASSTSSDATAGGSSGESHQL